MSDRIQQTTVSFKFKRGAGDSKRHFAIVTNLAADSQSEKLRDQFFEALGEDVDRRTLRVEGSSEFTPHSGFMVFVDLDEVIEEE